MKFMTGSHNRKAATVLKERGNFLLSLAALDDGTLPQNNLSFVKWNGRIARSLGYLSVNAGCLAFQ
jgi:hypothetical protein